MQKPPGGWGPPPGYPPPGHPPQQYPQHQGHGHGYGYGYGPAPMMPVPQAPMWRCHQCGYAGAPLEREKITTAGWIVFFVLLLFLCLPLCWLGLTMKQKYRICGHCSAKLGDVG